MSNYIASNRSLANEVKFSTDAGISPNMQVIIGESQKVQLLKLPNNSRNFTSEMIVWKIKTLKIDDLPYTSWDGPTYLFYVNQ